MLLYQAYVIGLAEIVVQKVLYISLASYEPHSVPESTSRVTELTTGVLGTKCVQNNKVSGIITRDYIFFYLFLAL